MDEATTTDIESFPLETIDEEGVAPETRLTTPYAAEALYQDLVQADNDASFNRAAIDGMFNGAPPWDPAALKSLGQSDRTNHNFGDAQGRRKQALSLYYDLTDSTRELMSVKTKFGGDDPRKAYWEKTIAEGITLTLRKGIINSLNTRRSGWFEFQFKNLINQFVTHGVSFATFGGRYGWKFRSCGLANFKFPRDTQATDDAIDVAAYNASYSVSELYSFYESGDERWDKEALKQLIRDSNMRGLLTKAGRTDSWEDYESELKQNSAYYGASCKVALVNIVVKEFDGKFSHFIIPDNSTIVQPQNGEPRKAHKGFVFQSLNCLDNVNQSFVSFTNGIGDGTFHSIRGLGYEIFNQIQVSNKLQSAMLDGVMEGCTTMIQPESESQTDVDKLALIHNGPRVILPAGVKKIDTQLRNFGDQILPVIDALSSQIGNNVGSYQARSIIPQRGTKTKFQVQTEITKESVLSASSVNMFYGSWGRLLSEIVRRIADEDNGTEMEDWEEVSALRVWLLHRNVPLEALYQIYEVNPVRAVGLGSPEYRLATMDQMTDMIPYMSEDGKKLLVLDRAAEIVGASSLERYFDVSGVPSTSEDERQAFEENGSVDRLWDIIFLQTDNHFIHLGTHFKYLDAILEPLGQPEVDPNALVAGFQKLTMMLPHVSLHTDAISEDRLRQQEAGLARQKLQQLSAQAARIQSQIEKAMADQQKQQVAEQQRQMAQQESYVKGLQDKLAQQEESGNASEQAKHEKLQQEIVAHQVRLRQQEEEFQQNMRHKDELTKQQIALTDAQAASKMITQMQPKP